MTDTNKSAEVAAVEEMVPGRVSQTEINKARKEGALEAAKEQAKESARFVLDGNLPGAGNIPQYLGDEDIQQWAPMLDQGVEAFKARIAKDAEFAVPEEKIHGLLALERNGQNRTDYVKAMMERLGLKPGELPGGGPDYTNDMSPITKL